MSVRVRLTVAVAVLVAVIAGLAALLAPAQVEEALIEDLFEAGAERQAALTADVFIEGFEFPLEGSVVVAQDVFPVDAKAFPFEEGGVFGIDDALTNLAPERLAELRELSGSDSIIVSLGKFQFIRLDPSGGEQLFIADPTTIDQPIVGFDEIIELTFTDPLLFDLTDVDGFEEFEQLQFDEEVPEQLLGSVRSVGGVDYIVFAETDSVDRTVRRVSTALWSIVPIAILLAAVATWLLAGRALRPVAAITAQTELITSGTLDERVPVPGSKDEISKLARTMNGMLDRLEEDDGRRRRFVSDASHELRTPVAVMRSEAEVALRVPEQTDVTELATGVLDESTRLATIIDDMLALARHDEGLPVPNTEVDLDDIVLAEAGRARRVPIDASGVSAGRVMGRADEFSNAVSHLLDNAARHADERVAVGLVSLKGRVFLTVDDDGPGVDVADREKVFERFARLDDARTRDRGGAGLGLAVVASAVERSGGSVSVETSPLGGARFVVDLPAV